MPSIHSGTEPANPPVHCNMSVPALTFVYLWLNALGSRGAIMRCDVRLVVCAEAHATYLSQRTPEQLLASPHLSADGSTPNERVRAAGYALPSPLYPLVGNNVESYFGGSDDPARALERLLDSPPHRAHILGEGGFAGQIVYGVGNVGLQWVVLTCPEIFEEVQL